MTNANTTLAELRAINIEKQREDKEDAARESQTESNLTGKPESKIVSKPESKMSNNTAGKQDRKPDSRKAGQADRLAAGKPSEQSAGNTESVSVRERLLAEAAGLAAAKVVMKTVSIKMDPDLDERLEAHCYALRKKKQDVIQDALLLYFETVEGK